MSAAAAIFDRGAWAPALLAVPLVVLLLVVLDRAAGKALATTLGPRARVLSSEASPGRRLLGRLLLGAAVLCAGLGALRPTFGAPEAEVEPRGVDVVLCLDVSRSMLARDVAPDRLSRAKAEARVLAARAVGDRLGLVLSAGEARPFVPLTNDRAAFSDLLDLADPLEVRRGGSDLGAALEAAEALLASGRSERGVVVLLSDGEDRGGRSVAVARRLAANGAVVHALGFGTALGGTIVVEGDAGPAFLKDAAGRDVVTALDAPSLARIAEAGGGTYADAGSREGALTSLYESRVLPLARSWAAAEGLRRRPDRYQVPLALALLLLFAEVALGTRRVRARVPRGANDAVPAPAPRAAPTRAAATAAVSLALAALLGAPGCGGADPARADADEAAAALVAGDLPRAEAAGRRLGSARGDDAQAYAAFVRGSVAFARSQAAEAESLRPDGDPVAAEAARSLAEDALAAWRFAATSRDDWPAARRNVERAILRVERLREKSADKSKRKPPQPPPDPPPDTRPPLPDVKPPEREAPLVTAEIPAGEVLGLLETLKAKDRERRATRRAEREAKARAGERDW